MAILSLKGIQYNIDVELSFTNLTFNNIQFLRKGFLMELNHQLPNNVTITNSVFENIENGYIWISTPDLGSTTITTEVNIINITANNIKEDETSFIFLENSGKLFISESKFTSIYSYSDGSVLSGATSKTQTLIYNSIFMNNTAQNGGVFSVLDESSIKCTT